MNESTLGVGSHGALRRVGRTDLTLVCLFSLVLLGPFISYRGTGGGDGSALRQVGYIGILLLTLLNVRRANIPIFIIPVSICAFLFWATLSLSWALDPSVAVRRLFLTTIIIWNVFLLVESTGYEVTIASVRLVLSIFLLINYLAVLGWPSQSIHQAATSDDPSIVGAWFGVLGNKNFAGPVCAITLLFFLFDAGSLNRAWQLVMLLATGYFLFRTNSKTSMAVMALAIGGGTLFRFYNPRHRVVAIHLALLVAGTTALIVYLNWAKVMAPFSSPDALTGRVQIWPLMFAFAKKHLMFGSGFGSFWNIGGRSPIASMTDGWVAKVMTGHNGYLDMLVQVGVPGLTLAVFALVLVPLFFFATDLHIDKTRGVLLFSCISFCIMHNSTESSLFDRDDAVHVFLILAIALARRISREDR